MQNLSLIIRPLPRMTYKNQLKIRISHPKTLAIVLIASSVLLSLAVAHADPTIWPTWAAGGGGKMFRM